MEIAHGNHDAVGYIIFSGNYTTPTKVGQLYRSSDIPLSQVRLMSSTELNHVTNKSSRRTTTVQFVESNEYSTR